MATPVADLRLRLRNAGVTEEQAAAITGAFEALSSQIRDVGNQVRSLQIGQRITITLLLLVLAAIIVPYVEDLYRMSAT